MKVDSQETLDEVYEEVVRLLKSGPVEKKVKCGARKGQPWFTKDIRQVCREFHRAESEWLRCVDQFKRREKRQRYVQKRRAYKRAVMRAKMMYEEQSSMELEKAMNNPKKWWRLEKKIKVADRRGGKADVTKVYDKDRNLKTGSEALEVWKQHFEEVLNGEQSPGVYEDAKGTERISVHSGPLDEEFSREEVRRALRSLKAKAAPGRDGLTAEMVDREVLVDLWWKLANLCWRHGLVPSMWRKGTVVPVPKKKDKGICEVDNFRGIAVVLVVYKLMCSMVQGRLVQIVEGKHLLAKEQGGFRRGRGCRDQILTLTLLGQMKMMTRKRGMFAAFIDFGKAYDSGDRSKLWRCLEDLGLQGRLVEFLKAAYADLRCEVKVGEEYSEPFVVTNGLRQGCILSPLLFSLYINSLTVELKKAEVGVVCKGWWIPALLYADDMVLLAEEEEMLSKELKILGEWCVEWAGM